MDIDKLLAENAGIKLDIGCGENKQQGGFVGIDIRDVPGVDIVHDVEVYPWPLPDECVVIAVCSHLVEHINPHKFGFVNFMNEIWRVLKPDAWIAIACPYAYSPGFAQDPTHCNMINEATFTYFDPDQPLYQIYKPKPWRIASLNWSPVGNIETILYKRKVDLNGSN